MSDMQKHPGSLEASDAQVAAQDLVSQAAKTSTAKKANTQKTGFGGLQAGFFAKDRSGKSSSSDRPTALHAKAETEAEQSATSDARPRTDGSDDSTDGQMIRQMVQKMSHCASSFLISRWIFSSKMAF